MPRAHLSGRAAARPAAAPSLSPATALVLLAALVGSLLAAQVVTGTAAGAVSEDDAAVDRSRVLVVGDSLTWRGSDELAAAHPSWTVDGVRGRNVFALRRTLEAHLAQETPEAVVIALGTNTASGYTKAHYRRAAALVPPRVPVVFVTPFRDPQRDTSPSAWEHARRTATYAGWMRQLSQEGGGRRCVAHWRRLVAERSWMLVDGVHQTARAERTWAAVVGSAVDRCGV